MYIQLCFQKRIFQTFSKTDIFAIFFEVLGICDRRFISQLKLIFDYILLYLGTYAALSQIFYCQKLRTFWGIFSPLKFGSCIKYDKSQVCGWPVRFLKICLLRLKIKETNAMYCLYLVENSNIFSMSPWKWHTKYVSVY